jgi:hypothetical protein
MASIDSLLTRAKRLHGTNDDVLEVEWQNMLDMEVESMMADLDAKISTMTPEELAAEEANALPPEEFEQLCTELNAALDVNAGAEKRAWFAQQRRRHRRGRR